MQTFSLTPAGLAVGSYHAVGGSEVSGRALRLVGLLARAPARAFAQKEWWVVETVSASSVQFSSVRLLSRVQVFVAPRSTARQASLSITNSQSLPKLVSIVSVMLSNHLILCPALLLLPLIFPSIRVFSNESALPIRWLKYWSFSFSISPSNEHPGLISLRMDWLDLLAVQGTLRSLLRHHSSIASILLRSAFFTVQLSHLYMIAGKTIALIRRTFISHLSCWHKPQSGWRSWRPEVRDQGVGGLTSPEGCLRVCRQPSSPCDLTCCAYTSSS